MTERKRTFHRPLALPPGNHSLAANVVLAEQARFGPTRIRSPPLFPLAALSRNRPRALPLMPNGLKA